MDFKALSDPVVLVGDSGKKQGFFSKIRPPLTNFSKNKQLLGGASTVLLLFAIGISVSLSQKPTQLSPRADTLDSPQPSLSSSVDPAYTGKGDGNSDGSIDLQDLSVLYSAWSSGAEVPPNSPIDFNDDGIINADDFSKMNDLIHSLGVIK